MIKNFKETLKTAFHVESTSDICKRMDSIRSNYLNSYDLCLLDMIRLNLYNLGLSYINDNRQIIEVIDNLELDPDFRQFIYDKRLVIETLVYNSIGNKVFIDNLDGYPNKFDRKRFYTMYDYLLKIKGMFAKELLHDPQVRGHFTATIGKDILMFEKLNIETELMVDSVE